MSWGRSQKVDWDVYTDEVLTLAVSVTRSVRIDFFKCTSASFSCFLFIKRFLRLLTSKYPFSAAK